MTQLVDRKLGCFYPATQVVGGAYAYNFDYLEAQVGRKFDVFSTFLDLSADYPGNPTAPTIRKQHSEIAAAAAAGHDILVGLGTAYTYVQCTDGNYYPVYATGADIRAGTFDAKFTALFNWLLGLGVTITVRFMWESNLGPNISQYYPGVTGYAATGTPVKPTSSPMTLMTSTGLSPITSPTDYIQTWQYLTNLLRGLTNASRLKMFYCPGCNDGSAAQAAGNTFTAMFPGTTYVDYVGYDTYNVIGTVWRNPLDTLRGPRDSDSTNPWAYDMLTVLHPTADVWIGEVNCMDQNDAKDASHTAVGHSKAQWYTDLFNIADDLPRLKVVNFFNQPGTRNTWPFNSSSSALAAFQAGFNFGPDATQHGVVAPAYVPGTGVPPVNPSNLNLPLVAEHSVGDIGHAAAHNSLAYWLNQVAKEDPSGFAGLAANTDGTIPALDIVRQAAGTSYIPFIKVKSPGGTLHDLFAVTIGTNTHLTFAVREDGRITWGPGDSGDADVFLARDAAGVLKVTGAGSVVANLAVTGYVSPNNLVMPNVASTPSAPAAGGGVQLFGQNDALKVRNPGLTYSLRPSPYEKFGTAVLPFPPEAASSTATALTSGVLYLVRLLVPDARTLSRVGFNIVTAGATLTSAQCLAGIYDVTGTLIGTTADQSGVWTATGGKNMTVTAVTSLAVEPGYVYAGILSNGTTGPAVSRSAGLGNWQITGGAGTNYGKYSTGLTALPTSLTLASITVDNDNKFFTVS